MTDFNTISELSVLKKQRSDLVNALATTSSSNWLQIHRERSLILGRNSLIVYNRVPKCGSRTVLDLFYLMRNRTYFHMKHSQKFIQYNLTKISEQEQAVKILRIEKPGIFDRHMYFLNFTK